MELQDDGFTQTLTLKEMDGANENQKWKRQSVDEVENWFMWSNSAHDKKSTNEFLAAPDNSALKMKSKIFCIF